MTNSTHVTHILHFMF